MIFLSYRTIALCISAQVRSNCVTTGKRFSSVLLACLCFIEYVLAVAPRNPPSSLAYLSVISSNSSTAVGRSAGMGIGGIVYLNFFQNVSSSNARLWSVKSFLDTFFVTESRLITSILSPSFSAATTELLLSALVASSGV